MIKIYLKLNLTWAIGWLQKPITKLMLFLHPGKSSESQQALGIEASGTFFIQVDETVTFLTSVSPTIS